MSAWRTSAPTRRWPLLRSRVSSPGMPLMSTSFAGVASRVFIIGMRLWPPARKRTSSPARLGRDRFVDRAGGEIVELGREHSVLLPAQRPAHTTVRLRGNVAFAPRAVHCGRIMRTEETDGHGHRAVLRRRPPSEIVRGDRIRSRLVATVPACAASSRGLPTPASSTSMKEPDAPIDMDPVGDEFVESLATERDDGRGARHRRAAVTPSTSCSTAGKTRW